MSENKKLPLNPNLSVENFNPEDYVQSYTNSKGETLTRLPFNAQLMWFKLVYPKGKIAVETRPGKGVIIAKARIYLDYKDPVEAYVAEGESSRGPSPDMPSINPRNWAQTAAIATALRYAGFGLEYDIAGEEPETITGEWDSLIDDSQPVAENGTASAANRGLKTPAKPEAQTSVGKPDSPDYENMTDEEAIKTAGEVVLVNGRYKGKTIAQAIAENSGYAGYVLNHFDKEDPVYKAVKVLNDAAMRFAE